MNLENLFSAPKIMVMLQEVVTTAANEREESIRRVFIDVTGQPSENAGYVTFIKTF